MSDFDVVVVGAGPAGSAAAWTCARAGARVALVDKAVFPRDKTCGDGLTPWALDLFDELGLAGELQQRFHKVHGFTISFKQRIMRFSWSAFKHRPYGLVAPRPELDQLLKENAVKAGASVFEGVKVTRPTVENGLVTGVVGIDGSGQEHTFSGAITIAADGAHSPVAKSLGMLPQQRAIAQALRITCEGPGGDADSLRIDAALEAPVKHAGTHGRPGFAYGWVFPMGSGRLNIGVGVVSPTRGRCVHTGALLREYLDELRDEYAVPPYETLHRGGELKGWQLPLAFAARPAWAPGVMLAGDAGGLADPFTGEGISGALRSGLAAGDTAVGALGNGDPSSLGAYEQALARRRGPYFKVMLPLVQQMANHPSASWAIRQALLRRQVTKPIYRGALVPAWKRCLG